MMIAFSCSPMIGNDPDDPLFVHEVMWAIRIRVDRSRDKASAIEPNNDWKIPAAVSLAFI